MALDIDSWDRAAFELMLRGIDLQALYDAPDAVVIDSGRQGHGKLLYAMPWGWRCRARRSASTAPRSHELRCATSNGLTVQDVLPRVSTHRPTNRTDGPAVVTGPACPCSPAPAGPVAVAADPGAPVDTLTNTTVEWDLLEPATLAIDADCSREDWITVGWRCTTPAPRAARSSGPTTCGTSGARGPRPSTLVSAMLQQWASFQDQQAHEREAGLAVQAGP